MTTTAAPDIVLAQLEPNPTIWNFYPTIEAAAAAAPEVNAREGADYHPMTYDEFEAAHNAHWLAGGLQEITAEQWHEALNVLPPMRWEHKDGVERFCMSEMLTGSITAQYAEFCGRYFMRNVNVADRSTYITGAEVVAFINPGFNPALVRIVRHRFSTTQGEVEVIYGDRRLAQYGDDIQLRANGWEGHSDSYWIEVARRAFEGGQLTPEGGRHAV
jgi:hypothetical protein